MPVNRIARHLEPSLSPPPPADPRGRHDFLSDAILRAVAAVTKLLDHDDPAVVLKAAKMILDVEKTRMRHGRRLLGVPDPEGVERAAMFDPLLGDPDYRTRTVSPEVAAELARLEEEDDDFDDDDEPAVRPIPYVMGVAPTPSPWPPPPPPAAKPLDPDPNDDDPAITGEQEYQRWFTGYYYRDRPGHADHRQPLACASG